MGEGGLVLGQGMGGMEGSVEEKEISKEGEETMVISSEDLSCSTSTSPQPHLSQTYLNHPRGQHYYHIGCLQRHRQFTFVFSFGRKPDMGPSDGAVY